MDNRQTETKAMGIAREQCSVLSCYDIILEEEKKLPQDFDYKKKTVYLGVSDGAEIHITYALRDSEQTEAKFIHFGGDGKYKAYVINEGDPVPEHYKEFADLSNAWWICFYDDWAKHVKIRGGARIYRAGQYGCLIVLAKNAQIEEVE